jgi:tetratricopeptide (TPR) repeat protein
MPTLRGWRLVRILLLAALTGPPVAPAQQAEWKKLNARVVELDRDGKYDEALPLAIQGVKLAQSTFGPVDPQLAVALSNLAQVYTDQGKYGSAEPIYLRAWEIIEKAKGGESLEASIFLGDLARFYNEQSLYAKAEPLYLRILHIDEKILDPGDPDLATDLNNLGTLYFRQGKYDKAKPLFERALAIDQKSSGPESAAVSMDAANLGLALDYLAQYAEAKPLLERALRIDEKVHGAGHPDVAHDLINLGVLSVDEGKYAEAEPLFRRALDIFGSALGPDHANVAMASSKLALVYDHLGKYAQAEPLFQNALEIDEKALGPEHSVVATDLNYLAQLYDHQGRFSKAEPLYQRALKIDEKVLGPDHPDQAALLENLAQVEFHLGRNELAESLDEHAVQIVEKAEGPNHPDLAAALGDLGGLYDYMGRYSEAESLYRRALAIQESALGVEHPAVATTLYNLATLFFHQGKYAAAEPFYQRALRIKEKTLGPDHPEVAADLNNLATLYYKQGKYTEAEQLYKRAYQIDVKALGPEDSTDAIDLNNLGLVYQKQQKFGDAEELFQRALSIEEKAAGPEAAAVALCLNNLATLDIARGKFAEAEPLVQRAIKIDEKALGPSHPEVAVDLNSLAVIYSKQGRFADAEPIFQRILAIHEKAFGPDHPDIATDLENFGLLYEYQDKYAEAQPLFLRAFDNLFGQFQYDFSYMTEKERLGFLATVADEFPAYFSFVYRFHDKDPQLIGSMYNLLLWEKGFIAGSVADMRRRIEASGDADSLRLLGQLTQKRTQIAALLSAQPQDREEWRARIDQLRSEADAIEKALVARSSTYAEHTKLDRATWQQVRDALHPGEAAVEFSRFRLYLNDWTDKSYYVALVVSREMRDEPQYIVLGEGTQIEGESITRFEHQLQTRGLDAEDAAAIPGQEAYGLIWTPLEQALRGKTRIYLSPDGVLNQLPLGIISGPDGRLLMERYDLRLLSSTRDILRSDLPESSPTALLVGNPLFSLSEAEQRAATQKVDLAQERPGVERTTPGSGELSRDRGNGTTLPLLPGTGLEVSAIAELMQQKQWRTNVYSGAMALKRVVQQAASPRVVHLATHGFFLPDQEVKNHPLGSNVPGDTENSENEDPMLRSGLYFAGADRTLSGKASPDDLDNGVLTALEAGNLNLKGTELVVLSACNTGQGDVRNGEGVFGLRRALEEAGAQEVLMSLWSVPDQETLELMKRFYSKWLSGIEIHEALKQAQLEMRAKVQAAHDGRDLPYYWGAFVLVGR